MFSKQQLNQVKGLVGNVGGDPKKFGDFLAVAPAVANLPQGVGDKLRPAIETKPEEFGFKGVAQAKDPLMEFLNRGARETPEALERRYGELFGGNEQFGFKGPSSMGMDAASTGALRGKLQSNLGKSLGRTRGALLRQAPIDFGQRQQVYQGLADANVRRVMGIEAQAQAAREAAKQKRSALTSSLFGLGGAAAGGAIAGPVGAGIGMGVGQTLGGL